MNNFHFGIDLWNFAELWMKQICGRFSRGLSRDYVGLPGKVNNLKVCLQSFVHRQLGIYIWLSRRRPTLEKIQSGSKLVWIVIGISKTIWTAARKYFNISGNTHKERISTSLSENSYKNDQICKVLKQMDTWNNLS